MLVTSCLHLLNKASVTHLAIQPLSREICNCLSAGKLCLILFRLEFSTGPSAYQTLSKGALGCRLRRLPLWSLKSVNFSFLFLFFPQHRHWGCYAMHVQGPTCVEDMNMTAACVAGFPWWHGEPAEDWSQLQRPTGHQQMLTVICFSSLLYFKGSSCCAAAKKDPWLFQWPQRHRSGQLEHLPTLINNHVQQQLKSSHY